MRASVGEGGPIPDTSILSMKGTAFLMSYDAEKGVYTASVR